MKVRCPVCGSAIPLEQICMEADLAFCPRCERDIDITLCIEEVPLRGEDLLQNPPNGAWFRREPGRFIVGASTRSSFAFTAVPVACFWNGLVIVKLIAPQIARGRFNFGATLAALPFVLVGSAMGCFALMTICGKVEITVGQISRAFVGVGPLGWSRRFDLSAVKAVYEEETLASYDGQFRSVIVIKGIGGRQVKFGTGLSDKRRRFVVNALRYLRKLGP